MPKVIHPGGPGMFKVELTDTGAIKITPPPTAQELALAELAKAPLTTITHVGGKVTKIETTHPSKETTMGSKYLDQDDHDFDDDNEVEGEDEAEGDDTEAEYEAQVEANAQPDFKVPSILFYYSNSHEATRYYQSMGNGQKPEFSTDKALAMVFTNLDHLKLAGRMMRACGYRGLKIEDATPYVDTIP
jgi:hypothetical protein